MKKKLKRIFWTLTGIISILIAITAIEIFTGGNALYKWDVHVILDVKDDLTGNDVDDYGLSYSMFDFNRYREAKFSNGSWIVAMEYCRGEGLISSFFNDRATPKPGFYTFKVSAQGYEDKLIIGKLGKLRSLSLNNEFEVLLPEVKLHKLDS
jgi:hypothetical protein